MPDLPVLSGLSGSVDPIIVKGGIFEGSYSIIPSTAESQTLATSGKTLARDVTIAKIPFYEASNLDGGITVTIG